MTIMSTKILIWDNVFSNTGEDIELHRSINEDLTIQEGVATKDNVDINNFKLQVKEILKDIKEQKKRVKEGRKEGNEGGRSLKD